MKVSSIPNYTYFNLIIMKVTQLLCLQCFFNTSWRNIRHFSIGLWCSPMLAGYMRRLQGPNHSSHKTLLRAVRASSNLEDEVMSPSGTKSNLASSILWKQWQEEGVEQTRDRAASRAAAGSTGQHLPASSPTLMHMPWLPSGHPRRHHPVLLYRDQVGPAATLGHA